MRGHVVGHRRGLDATKGETRAAKGLAANSADRRLRQAAVEYHRLTSGSAIGFLQVELLCE
jgi:hypothetical protein